MTDADAIVWAEPGFAELTWEWDDMHTPRALTRLGQAYVETLAAGMNSGAGRSGAGPSALPIRVLATVVNGYAYFAMSVDAPPDERAALLDEATARRKAEIGRTEAWWRDDLKPEALAIYRAMDALPAPGASAAELAEAWERAWQMVERIWQIHFGVIVGPYQVLDDLIDSLKGQVEGVSDAEILGLASGAVDDLARVEADLTDLARRAAADPGLLDRLRSTPAPTLADVRGLPGGGAFADAVQTFLAVHGHLGHLTEDLHEPSWSADPRRLLADLAIRVERDDGAATARRDARAVDAERLLQRIRKTLADRPVELARFEETLAAARAIGWLTEGHNYWLDRMCGDRFRRFTRRIGACLVEAGVIDAVEDICHLAPDEVGAVLRRPEDRRRLIAERVAEHAHRAATTPPRTIGKPPGAVDPADADRFDGARYASTDTAVLRGTGASAGIVRAVARVVQGPADFDRVRPGDIVVARASNPGWVPLFAIAGGFVTDTGGVLSHAAVVAREFGVPAVVGTGDATIRIGDGQIVELDGSTGYVRLG